MDTGHITFHSLYWHSACSIEHMQYVVELNLFELDFDSKFHFQT